jgi:uncharacterized ParB-like nuclease family protein
VIRTRKQQALRLLPSRAVHEIVIGEACKMKGLCNPCHYRCLRVDGFTPMAETLRTIYVISLKEIEISEDNVRESRPTTDIEELAESIRLHGLLQPVVLKGEYGHPKYELIGGLRRLLAHEKLGRKTIRAVFAGTCSRPGFRLPGGRNAKTHIYEHGCRFYNRACV